MRAFVGWLLFFTVCGLVMTAVAWLLGSAGVVFG